MVEINEINETVAATEVPATKQVIDAGSEPRPMPAGGLPGRKTISITDSRNGQAVPLDSAAGYSGAAHGAPTRTIINGEGHPMSGIGREGGLPAPKTTIIDSRTGQAVSQDSMVGRTVMGTGHYTGATHGAPTQTIINGEPGHILTAGNYRGGTVSGASSTRTIQNSAPLHQHGSMGTLPPRTTHGASPIQHHSTGHMLPQTISGGIGPQSRVSGPSFGSYPGAPGSPRITQGSSPVTGGLPPQISAGGLVSGPSFGSYPGAPGSPRITQGSSPVSGHLPPQISQGGRVSGPSFGSYPGAPGSPRMTHGSSSMTGQLPPQITSGGRVSSPSFGSYPGTPLPSGISHGSSPIQHRSTGHLPPQGISAGMSSHSRVPGSSFGSYPGTPAFNYGPQRASAPISSYPGSSQYSSSLPPVPSMGGSRYSPY